MNATSNLSSSLHWVQGELAQSLGRVRGLIEQHMEKPDDQLPLQQAVVELHQVRGTAAMIQCAGISGLAEEMKQALQDLLQSQITETEGVYAALLGASVQLGDYVDALVTGMQDSVLVFQPAINELRVARGKPAVTDADVFADQPALAALPVNLPASAARKPGAAQEAAKKFQPVFQQNLLFWIKNQDVQLAQGRLGKVSEQIAAAASTTPVYQLWRMVAALAEALLTKGLDDGPELKRLMGRAVAQLKLLAERGEAAAAESAGTLPYQFLYYVGRSKSQGPRVAALKNAYALARLLPSPEVVDGLRLKIRGPNSTLLTRLSEEIRKDLAVVKDQIDLTVRGGGKTPVNLAPTVEKLNRVGVTLSMLGLSALQEVIQNQARALAVLSASPSAAAASRSQLEMQSGISPGASAGDNKSFSMTPATDPAWLELATALLRVEHSLDDALYRQLRRSRLEPSTAAAPESLTGGVPMIDVQEGREALLRESLVDLAKLKSAADAFLQSGAAEQKSDAARLLAQIEPGLRILGSERAAGLVGTLCRYLQGPEFDRVRADRALAERFADAIAGVEYYLEGLRRQDPDADARVDRLAGYVEKLAPRDAPGASAGDISSSTITPAAAPEAIPATKPAAAGPPADEIDPEIRGIFLDEAGEVLQQLGEQLPKLRKNAGDTGAWQEIRRGFHTLKGSGRMVGAMDIGEFSWSVEHLLNRCLEGTRPFSPAVLELVEAAKGFIPGLIESFRDRKPCDPAAQALQVLAQRLAQGEPEKKPDDDLLAIFAGDARERLGAVRDWIQRQDLAQSQFVIESEVSRAFHTLHGSAALVNAQAVAQLAGELENYLAALRSARLPLPAGGLQLLADAANQLNQWIEQLVSGNPAPADIQPWMQRLAEAHAALPVAASRSQLEMQSGISPSASAGDKSSFSMTPAETRQPAQAAAAPSAAEAFAHQAFTQLIAIEQQLGRWEKQPADAAPPQVLRALFQSLRGEALAAQCAPQARVAEAFDHSLSQPPADPAPDYFQSLREIVEGMYAQLDAFRENSLSDDGAGLAERVLSLPAAVAAEEVLEMPPVASADEAEQAPEAPAEEVLEVSPVLTEAEPEPEPVEERAAPAVAVADTPADPELLSIFQAEAEELLDSMNQHISVLETDPAAREPLPGLARDLHTFKGGARMSGLMSMGTAAHEMESRVEKLTDGRISAGVTAIAQLRTQWEGLQLLHDRLRSSALLAAQAALVERPEPLAPPLAPVLTPEPALPVKTQDLPPAAAAPDTPRREQSLPAAPVVRPQAEPLVSVQTPKPAATPMLTPETLAAAGWDAQLFWIPDDVRDDQAARREMARVPVERLDKMLNEAGEISIYRSRIEQHYTGLQSQLNEMQQTLARVRGQLRAMDIETESQIAARGFSQNVEQDRGKHAEFDPLEMDRYSRMQELSRALSESVGDLSALRGTMDEQLSEAETLLMQQGRVNTEVQQGLMGTLMVPFSRQTQRLERVVAQTAKDTGKQAEVRFEGVEQELDRNVLERMTAPLEHLLRNSVVHGIEAPAQRKTRGKSEAGVIRVNLRREGTQLAIEVRDDGEGLNYEAIRRTAVERGLMAKNAKLRDSEVAMFIFEAGFSTARELTQSAGRGVGMDVVAAEVKQLGGTLELTSEPGQGARFLIRLPLTLALSQVLLVNVGGEVYAIPLPTLESIARLPRDKLTEYLRDDGPRFNYGGLEYGVRRLGDLLGAPPVETAPGTRTVPAVLIRLGEGLAGAERRVAVVVDALLGNREIVSKAVGPQVSAVQGISGGTILPDGRVVLILDVPALLTNRARRAAVAATSREEVEAAPLADERQTIMVVDDSITIRRVTERLLDKNGFRVITAKDGLDAMAQLQTESPAVILLDIEMPRADGFEVAAFIRNNARIQHVPIIMITSRSGEKHRERARQIGVNRYVIKPYQEEQLMGEVRAVLPVVPS